jgi:hypothetical protein
VLLHQVSGFGDRTSPDDFDDRTTYDLFHKNVVGNTLRSDNFPENVRFRDDSDDAILVFDQHTSDFVMRHEFGRFNGRGPSPDIDELSSHKLLDSNHTVLLVYLSIGGLL